MKPRNLVVVFTALAIGALSQGCANRNVEDYNNELTSEHVAKIQREAGTWDGALMSASGAELAGITIDMSPETVYGGASNTGSQNVGLQGSVVITPPGSPSIRIGFAGGFYDFTNRNYRVSQPVTRADGSMGSVEIAGVFTDTTMTGTIWAGAYNQYTASYTLTRNGPMPSSSNLVSAAGKSAAGHMAPIAQNYSAVISNPNALDPTDPSEPVTLKILDVKNSDQRFLSYFEPLTLVDLELTLGAVTDGTAPTDTVNTALYPNAQYDPITKQIVGHATGTSTLNELDCTDNNAGGWNCTLSGPVPLIIPFTPDHS
jgi:hypothetical protein